MTTAMEWLDQARGEDSVREVARKIGTTHATLYRQASAGQLSFELVRDIARAYGRPVLAEIVANGHLTREEAGVTDAEALLRAVADDQLVMEIARRLDAPVVSSLFERPISEAFEVASNVSGSRDDMTQESHALAAYDDEDWQARQEAENE